MAGGSVQLSSGASEFMSGIYRHEVHDGKDISIRKQRGANGIVRESGDQRNLETPWGFPVDASFIAVLAREANPGP